MNPLLWTLQILLALHTVMGAVWKFSHSAEETMPSLKAIPAAAWLALAMFEILCSVGLFLPALNKPLAILAPIAAIGIGAEMIFFSVMHVSSGETNFGPMIYWWVVAGLCAFVAYGRLVLKPL